MNDHQLFADCDVHAPSALSTNKTVLTLVTVALMLSLIGCNKAQDSAAAMSSMTEEAVESRIQKVGEVSLGESQHALRTGEEVYKAQCSTCHAAGLLGGPKFGDAVAWGPRIKTGYEALLNSALKGKNKMTAQGGGTFSDYEVGRAVVYMANAGGAKFDEPKEPAGAVGAAEPAASAASAAK